MLAFQNDLDAALRKNRKGENDRLHSPVSNLGSCFASFGRLYRQGEKACLDVAAVLAGDAPNLGCDRRLTNRMNLEMVKL